jgi:cold shock CspA family protein/ribosome-associated translation inhibitor RaiA
METAPEIQFQGMAGTPQIEDVISAHIGQLEELFGRITACRVVVKAPSQHHHKGGLYEVHIRLALPQGREVNVSRTPTPDERHSDLTFAINDAFKHARRQLEDKVRLTRGDVKNDERPPIGTVVRLDPSGEFGFLQAGDGQEIYFHRNSVLNDGFAKLQVGSRVAFAEEPGDKGPQATTVRLAGKHGLRV